MTNAAEYPSSRSPVLPRGVREPRPRRDASGQQSRGPAPALLFPLGTVRATPAARHALAEASENPVQYLARHATGDWGEVSAEDGAANDRALHTGGRLQSEYRLRAGVRLWVLTEADRSATTLLLPSDY